MAPHEPVDPHEQQEVIDYVKDEVKGKRMPLNDARKLLFEWKLKAMEIEEIINEAQKD